jgi:hypothetical protein
MRALVLLGCIFAMGCGSSGTTAKDAGGTGGTMTPGGGSMPVQCTHFVESGAVVVPGAIVHADGTREAVPACGADGGVADMSSPQLDLAGAQDLAPPPLPPDLAMQPVTPSPDLGTTQGSPNADMATTAQDPGVGGWTEWTNLLTPSGASFLEVRFTVPPVPKTAGQQTIFLFPSFTADTNPPIIQPVLQWGPSAAGGGKYWSIASWYLDADANSYYGKLVKVNAGDVIDGLIAGTNCANAVCASWTITTTDVTQPTVVSTLTTTAGGYKDTQVQGGVLEVYDLTTCAEYPAGPTSFTSLVLKDESGAVVTPQWIQGSANLIAGCTYGITTPSSSEIDLAY